MADSIMAIDAAAAAEINSPVDGFDGGVWRCDGRDFVVIATHTWALRTSAGAWVPAVAFQAFAPGEDEPHAYVMARADFLADFTPAPAE